MRLVPMSAGALGAEVHDFDPRTATSDDAAELRRAIYEHKLVLVRGKTPLTAHEYVGFGRQLGTLQIYPMDNYRHPELPEVYVSSSLPDKQMGVAHTGYYWHTDGSWDQEPISITMLCPQELMGGGDRQTQYLDTEAVLSSLEPEMRALVESMRIVHSANGFYKVRTSDVAATRDLREIEERVYRGCLGAVHPAAITHPATGRRFLYLGEFASSIVGMTSTQSERYMTRLRQATYRPEFVTTVTWRLGDLILWDNRSTLHRGGTVDADKAAMAFRLSVYDALPFYVENIAKMGFCQTHRTTNTPATAATLANAAVAAAAK